MSRESELYEKEVAEKLDKIPGVSAKKLGNNSYSDVFIKYKGNSTWLEVKMNHTDSLFNSRIFYAEGKWQTTYAGEGASTVVDMTNESREASDFIAHIISHYNFVPSTLRLPTTKGGLALPGALPFDRMNEFLNHPSRSGKYQYIVKGSDINLGSLLRKHYITGKTKPAYYIQTGDDFFRIAIDNPLRLDEKIPVIQGVGAFKIRIAFSKGTFYEIVPELKFKNLMSSPYSIKPASKKINPFS
jgi:hypothetical protein